MKRKKKVIPSESNNAQPLIKKKGKNEKKNSESTVSHIQMNSKAAQTA